MQGINSQCKACCAYGKAKVTHRSRDYPEDSMCSLEEYHEVFWGKCRCCPKSPAYSVDRIDSDQGYTVDNIHSLCWKHNQMKMDMSWDAFIKASLEVVLELGNLPQKKRKINGKKVKQEQTLFPL